MKTFILLISNKPEDLEFANEASKASEYPLVHVLKPEDAIAILENRKGQVIILMSCQTRVCLQRLKSSLGQFIGEEPGQISSGFLHSLGNEQLSSLAKESRRVFGHYVIKHIRNPIESGQLYGRILKMLYSEAIPGVEELISAKEKIRELRLEHSADRQRICEMVAGILTSEVDLSRRVSMVLVNAVDELLMNAIYDAPVDQEGKPIFASPSPSVPVNLKGKHSVEFQMGFDDHYIAFSVVDHFGSIDKSKILEHVLKEEDLASSNDLTKAGIGLFVTFQSGGSLIFRAQPNNRTTATVIFKNTKRLVEQLEQFKFLSVHID